MLNPFKIPRYELIKSPFDGDIINLSQVNDKAFSAKLLGDGFAVIPSSNTCVAPCDGKVIHIFPTNHAFVLQSKNNLEILVHIGIDTVNLKGQGFKRYVNVGEFVIKNQLIMDVDFKYIKDSGYDIVTPVVVINMEKVKKMNIDLKDKEKTLKVSV